MEELNGGESGAGLKDGSGLAARVFTAPPPSKKYLGIKATKTGGAAVAKKEPHTDRDPIVMDISNQLGSERRNHPIRRLLSNVGLRIYYLGPIQRRRCVWL